ncbi:MAG: hypothetical protein K9M54_01670 [Kiritimatiellales bacterium]|nr:hypothetical protein [Kiritimatiellales bacterium]
MPVPPAPIDPGVLEHLVYEALSELGWHADAKRLANRIACLHIGLPREDEFAVVCSWLGRCVLIHKLNQHVAPKNSSDTFRIPDLLAVFRVDGKEIPVLVEVKSKQSRTLSFRHDYYAGLKRYADTVRLPILVAWKYNGLWTLFDIEHMVLAKTNFNVTFEKAMAEGLLGILAGDFSYSLAKGAGLHIRMRKDELISELQGCQKWKAVIDDTYHTDGSGQERRDLSPAVQSLFFAHTLEESEIHSATHVHMHFTIGEDKNKFAHMSLVRLLNWQEPTDRSVDWRSVATRPVTIPGVTDFEKSAEEAMREKLVTHIFHFKPQTIPRFLDAT